MGMALGGGIHYDGQSEKALHWFQHEPEGVHLLCSVSGEIVSIFFPPDCMIADLYVSLSPFSCCFGEA